MYRVLSWIFMMHVWMVWMRNKNVNDENLSRENKQMK